MIVHYLQWVVHHKRQGKHLGHFVPHKRLVHNCNLHTYMYAHKHKLTNTTAVVIIGAISKELTQQLSVCMPPHLPLLWLSLQPLHEHLPEHEDVVIAARGVASADVVLHHLQTEEPNVVVADTGEG